MSVGAFYTVIKTLETVVELFDTVVERFNKCVMSLETVIKCFLWT